MNQKINYYTKMRRPPSINSDHKLNILKTVHSHITLVFSLPLIALSIPYSNFHTLSLRIARMDKFFLLTVGICLIMVNIYFYIIRQPHHTQRNVKLLLFAIGFCNHGGEVEFQMIRNTTMLKIYEREH